MRHERNLGVEVRNGKHEIRNQCEIRKANHQNAPIRGVSSISDSDSAIVSKFAIRDARFKRRFHPPCAGRGPRRGSAILQFALVLPILLSVALLAADYGRVPFYWMAVTNAARVGAGYASANYYSSMSSTQLTNWQNATVTAVKGEFAGNAWYQAANLTVSNPTATKDSSGYYYVKVTVTYSFKTLVNWTFFSGYNKSISLTRTVVMRVTPLTT